MKYIINIIFLLCCFSSCTEQEISSVERQDLFYIDIGPMEDQIALYNLESGSRIRKAELAMKDGFFYISDANGGKIVRYNSFGDLLFMVYNNETSPDPVALQKKTEDGMQSTRWAVSYPLRSPGKIAVDSRKHFYVEEKLSNDLHGFDSENKALLDSVVLHFDAEGNFIEYLGQGGKGGSPFPHISGLYVSEDDEIAVVCIMPGGWHTFWYSPQGEQLFLIQINNGSIPFPPDWQGASASIDTIMAAPSARKLYAKIDYYRDVFDESTKAKISTEPFRSLIWILNIEDGKYEKSLEAPFFEISFSENGKEINMNLPYSMFGLLENGGIMLYFPVETGYSVLRMEPESQRHRRAFIQVDPDELQFSAFHLSPEGILSAILVENRRIKAVWWRMDNSMGIQP
ncbi:MAG: hypothetical protein FWH41_05400 [Treponema sp.]|nr:hypothetical protein [Treponema sp.]